MEVTESGKGWIKEKDGKDVQRWPLEVSGQSVRSAWVSRPASLVEPQLCFLLISLHV